MSLLARTLVVAAWLLSLWTVAAIGQTPRVTTPEWTPAPDKIFSGSEIGFRVDRLDGTIPVGTFMVRVNGRWVEVEAQAVPQVRKTGR